ncbi:hypothetical protein NGRA_2284 [Nosema granulosis]|uniref:Uncharacterized protein n=1 Tax=Nosema granulosis TaxID=83296 RepID=A0A9P6GXF6_9MICR|nr:hypothetical protein NGRA_2284 [Nosema granulosis]
MPKLFKKFKIAKKIKAEKEKQKPKIGTLKVDKTHTGPRDEVEAILLLLDTRPSSAFRRILSLDSRILNINLFLIAKKAFPVFLDIGFNIKILSRLNSCDSSPALHNLFYDYLRVAILAGYSYKSLFNFMLRNCSNVLRDNKQELLEILDDLECKHKIDNLKENAKRVIFSDRIFYYNNHFEKL